MNATIIVGLFLCVLSLVEPSFSDAEDWSEASY